MKSNVESERVHTNQSSINNEANAFTENTTEQANTKATPEKRLTQQMLIQIQFLKMYQHKLPMKKSHKLANNLRHNQQIQKLKASCRSKFSR